MKGYQYLYAVNGQEGAIELDAIVSEAKSKQFEVGRTTPSVISILLRQPIDKSINGFLNNNNNLNWLTGSLGSRHLMIYERTPSQRWAEHIISTFRIKRNKIPCVIFFHRYGDNENDFYVSYWHLPGRNKSYKHAFENIIIQTEKLDADFNSKKGLRKIKRRLLWRNLWTSAKGVLLSLTRLGLEQLTTKLVEMPFENEK